MHLKKSIALIVFILFMIQQREAGSQTELRLAQEQKQSLKNSVRAEDVAPELNNSKQNILGSQRKSEIEVQPDLQKSNEPIEGEQLRSNIGLPENQKFINPAANLNNSQEFKNSIEENLNNNSSKLLGSNAQESAKEVDEGSRKIVVLAGPGSEKIGGDNKSKNLGSHSNLPLHKFEPQKIIAYAIYAILAVSGVYVALFGFRVFRLLMIILGFYVSYYGILFALTEMNAYKASEIGHQMGLFFGCIILGFILSILCYMLDKINFVIFGMAVASVVALFSAQFFIEFSDSQDRIILGGIYLISAVLSSALAFLILDHFIIWGSSFVGAVITPINIGVILGDFKSFEDREKIPLDRWRDFRVYLLACGLMFITGLAAQYYLRRRIIKRMQDSNLEEIRGTSFLN